MKYATRLQNTVFPLCAGWLLGCPLMVPYALLYIYILYRKEDDRLSPNKQDKCT